MAQSPGMHADRSSCRKPEVQSSEQSIHPERFRSLSPFERIITTHAPILESLLLQIPTDGVIKLYQTSSYLRNFLSTYPTAWKYLSFRLFYPSGTQPQMGARFVSATTATDPLALPRRSQPYALDQLIMSMVVPFSPCLTVLELDNTAVSGQILISTVLYSRRETLEHLSVRGCKNVSLKYHIIPYLTMFGLQYDVDMEKNLGSSLATKRLALKSIYTYRCRHHRRRPYLTTSLMRKDSDSEPTHELVNLCHKLGIWTDTAWCTTPAGRCLRRRSYVSVRSPQGMPEVWVVFDRLWRSKNWLGCVEQTGRPPSNRDGKLWEHEETGCHGEPLGTGEGRDFGEGKMKPAHLRRSHRKFVENIRCDNCDALIGERCEQCSILMHCVGCRKTLCASCAYERPYHRLQPELSSELSSPAATGGAQRFWWAPGATISPCLMQDPPVLEPLANNVPPFTLPLSSFPAIKFHWCCTEPIFSGGGGISIRSAFRDVDQVRAAPLPRGQGWEHMEDSSNEWSMTFPKYAYGDPERPDYSLESGHIAMMRWLLGSPSRPVSACPRNLCQECYDSPQWKVHCKSCSKPLCIEHDLRGLRLRICGYRDLAFERVAIQTRGAGWRRKPTGSSVRVQLPYRPVMPARSAASSFSDGHPVEEVVDMDGDNGDQQAPGASQYLPSATESNHSRCSSSSLSDELDQPFEATKWQGCQSFFCPQYQALGDQRQRCHSVLLECTSCSVYVCEECIEANPRCHCSYCKVNYLCPNCRKIRENDGTCRRAEEELKAQLRLKWKKDKEALEKLLERKMADEMLGYANQFFISLHGEGDSGEASEEQQAPQVQSQPQQEMVDPSADLFGHFLGTTSTAASEGPEYATPAGQDEELFTDAFGSDELNFDDEWI